MQEEFLLYFLQKAETACLRTPIGATIDRWKIPVLDTLRQGWDCVDGSLRAFSFQEWWEGSVPISSENEEKKEEPKEKEKFA